MKLPLFFQFLFIFSILVSTNPTSAQCLDDQKSSLLTLFGSVHPPSWTPNTDCCSQWEGITCDVSTGHVKGLGPATCWIKASINFTSLISLSSLRYLDLSPCNLGGPFPAEIFQLRNLETLYLSNNPHLTGPLPEFPFGSRLQILSLSRTNFSGGLPSSFGNLRHLQRLELQGCNFSGTIPSSLGGISQLLHLDISYNSFSGEIQSLENLKQLTHLDLSSNCFSGRIPSLGSLKHVEEIVLSNNNFSGPIDSSFGENGLLNLTTLDLRNNSLNGKIPSSLFRLPSLLYLDLSKNHFDAPLDEFADTVSPLNYLDLSNNKLQGPIPKSLFHLTRLARLMLSSNNFSGIVDLSSFQHGKNLVSLDLSDNNLSINASRGTNTSLPQITNLKLSSCNLREFPEFLRKQSELSFLDLSNNKIDGEIPNWVWRIGNGMTLRYLNLSHNMLYGLELHAVDLSLSLIHTLDLHSNMLQGSIPNPPSSIDFLDYSHNNFTSVIPTNISLNLIYFSLSNNNISGEIPPSICAASNLFLLDLSLNNLSGSIPTCLGQMDDLLVLNLGKNSFSGVIPQSFGDGCSLRTLNLNGNLLEGSLPESLANCTLLEVLNIGNNLINDSFPSWLGSLKQLRVLILRANKFYGPIQRPGHQNAFSQLQIIDVSFNGFIGNLSSEWFRNLKAMIDGEVGRPSLGNYLLDDNPQYHQDSVGLTLKRLEMEYLNILTIPTSIDLSSNRFHGSIPEEIGNLKYLYALNMSHNEFIGPIPSSFGNLLQLESLDLSMNQLSGEIPTELTALTFLSVLDLSQNRLRGKIPQRQQFLTFENDSFEGNPGLCGFPLSMQCEAPQEPEAPGEPRSANLPSRKHFDWRYMCMGLGFGFGNWMVMGPLIFWPRGRLWYYKHVDKILAMAIVWWDICGMRMTILQNRAYDRVRHTLLRR